METTNYSSTIYEFFNFNKIPILETFDSHMLSTSLWGIIYGLVTQDYKGSIFSPYLFISTIISTVILYKILSEFIDNKFAFLIVLLLPVNPLPVPYDDAYIFPTYSINLSLFSVLYFIKFLKQKNYKNIILFWLAAIFSIIFKLDTGISYTLPCLILLFIESIFFQNFRKEYYISLISITTFISALVLTAASIKNINLYQRINELYDIISSNQLWGYPQLGITTQNTLLSIFTRFIY
jgi:hypothetical protein